VALEETETAELSATVLAVLVLQHPRAGEALLHLLSRRLRSTDDLVTQLSYTVSPPTRSEDTAGIRLPD
jgi:CRP-like cAMP-binding protein